MKKRIFLRYVVFFKRSYGPRAPMIALFLLCGSAAAQPTNFEVLRELCRQLAFRVDSALDRSAPRGVGLAQQPAVETQTPERLLSSCLFEVFAQNSRPVFVRNDSSRFQEQASAIVKFKLTACEVSYRKLAKPGWFRKAPIERAARVSADFDVYDAQTGRIYLQGLLTASGADTLKVKPQKLETSSLPYTAGVWQAVENRRSWVEPVLLTAATGAIIYAFYSLRSQ